MESRKPSLKYKGVVLQPTGRWGAQIYDNHQRVWLGTFNDEDEAARAFDVAAQQFCGRDAAINFELINDEAEAASLESLSKDDIADMLRNHSYIDELAQCKKRYWFDGSGSFGARDGGGTARKDLFEKAVAPSDIELNRLVVPKQHAEKHFAPLISGTSASGHNTSYCNGVLLNIEDAGGKIWRYRYTYWSTSQNHVLTKGWSRFVKENNMKAGDTVSFHRSMGPDKKLYIDFKRKESGPPSGSVIGSVPVQPVRLFGINTFDVGVNSGYGET